MFPLKVVHGEKMSLEDRLSQGVKYDALKNQGTKPVSLKKIEITGGDFSNHFYDKLLSPALNVKDGVQLTVLDDELTSIQQRLLYTGLFRDVSVKLDLDGAPQVPTLLQGAPQQPGSSSKPLPVKATILLKELPLLKYQSFSKSTDNDVSCGVRYLNPNVSQNGDSLLVDVNLQYDPTARAITKNVWSLTYLAPSWISSEGSKFVLTPAVSSVDARKWASHKQYSVGGLLGLQRLCFKKCGDSIITNGLVGELRQVTDISNNASDAIRTYAGGDLKLGFQSHLGHDTREYVGRFTRDGSYGELNFELSGHNSVDYSHGSQEEIKLQPFIKSVGHYEGARSFFCDNFTLGYTVDTGFIKSLINADDKLHISDKFLLGGLGSLQGFRLNSVGLKSGHDYVGGSSLFKADLRLFTRLPNTKRESPLRLYNYVNFGDVYETKTLSALGDLIASGDFITKSAMSTGVGLSYKADNATLDLSYNVPLSSRSQDSASPGLNFAVTLNFK